MKTYTILIPLLICAFSFAQTPVENQNQENTIQEENIAEEEESAIENEKLKELATKRTIALQKELNLNNYTSSILQKTIIEYSKKANKIIQSNMSEDDKTMSLSNLVYFQNEELKEILTVPQFYQYLKLKNIR
ncbi:hypothetical protein [Aquimarina sp. RZ0]|uniref:hypothetical protein n=1 Tax=Aquimarina sp. RZ0 TaxID=2607730 RepID=UPI0011F38302|nr:hypothetical protein [Aquimarina sp. RZ0]KAA1244799.1 hypothetical protein F0000_15035 [Aquimarina sp. RZ0]